MHLQRVSAGCLSALLRTCVPAGMLASGSVLPTAMGAPCPTRSTCPAATF